MFDVALDGLGVFVGGLEGVGNVDVGEVTGEIVDEITGSSLFTNNHWLISGEFRSNHSKLWLTCSYDLSNDFLIEAGIVVLSFKYFTWNIIIIK